MALTKHAANEWGRYGITVNVICPAAMSEGAEKFRDTQPERWSQVLREIPLGRMGDPVTDIAPTIVALATDLRYLTGATLDAGRRALHPSLTIPPTHTPVIDGLRSNIMGFSGQVALVTGGTRGIGASITRRLLTEGATVAAVYAGNDDAAHALAAAVAADGLPGTLTLHRADIGDPDACRAVVADVVAAHGRLDHLVNNAGLLVENSVRKMTVDEWNLAIAVNLSASFHLAQAALEPMLANGFGRIVNVSSVTALMGNPVEAGYGAAKAGLHGLLALVGPIRGPQGDHRQRRRPRRVRDRHDQRDGARRPGGDQVDDPGRSTG